MIKIKMYKGLLFSLVFLSLLSSCKEKEVKKKPNFLFILVDDQPYDALESSKRYPFLKTPNMQRLQDEGVTFKNYFVTQSICSPSRASFLTGVYPHIHGVNQNNKYVDPDWNDFEPYSVYLQKAGYETAHIGKIHMAHFHGKKHIRPGFDYWYSFIGQGEYFDPMVNDNGKEYVQKGYITDILTEKAVDWLDHRDPSKPFMLNLWHKGVHEPHSPAPRHEWMYKNDSLPTPPYDTHLENFKGKPEWQRIKAWDSKWKEYVHSDTIAPKPWPIKGYKFKKLLECLGAVDESVGRVLAELDRLGELDNTVIIFSSDNGYFMGEHGYWDKRIAYENSMRIPMIIRYPKKIKPGTSTDKLALNIDLAPTILDLAGIKAPDYMQGASMVPLFDTQKDDKDWRKAFMFEYYVDDAYPYAGPNMLAIRTEKYKLVDDFLSDDIDELYDLENDPGEMHNLINDPEYDSIEKDLREKLEDLKIKYKYNPDRDWWLRTQIPEKKQK
ncbi:acetylglucosamine-6-sulfatase [Yeosuana aromativorans]|uniref:Acetylglucosamine-6-sulfatase n=1 Tax=Yeosuana aromativorans TaxID=288019 RepID=A0A8J3BR45_9FLAO|nr:sulfatase [Yeosuana aromativorans]GGK27430.1 acetylglucosamine-6-sulfatase [Yeosuana aromativorans]